MPPERPPTAAVVLAAGQASRMGRQKPLLDFGGVPLVRHAVLRAGEAGFDPIVVVAAEPMAEFERALDGLEVVLRLNDRALEGISTSIAAGLAALGTGVEWAALLLADQPFVPVVHLRALERRAAAPFLVVASRYDGTEGVPALFARAVFPRLTALTGDRGCKSVIRALADRACLLDCPEAALDIDTPDDYARALRAARAHVSAS